MSPAAPMRLLSATLLCSLLYVASQTTGQSTTSVFPVVSPSTQPTSASRIFAPDVVEALSGRGIRTLENWVVATQPTAGSGPAAGSFRSGIPESVSRFADGVASKQAGKNLTGLQSLREIDETMRHQNTASIVGDRPFRSGLDTVPNRESVVATVAALRPAFFVCSDKIDNEPIPALWIQPITQANNDAFIERTCHSVGLLSWQAAPDPPIPVGSCFVVAPHLVMTNRHVAAEFATQQGAFKANQFNNQPVVVTVDFSADKCGALATPIVVTKIVYLAPEDGPDVALLEIADGMKNLQPLPLCCKKLAGALGGTNVSAIGYPFQDPAVPADVELSVFGNLYGVKRISPGRLLAESDSPSSVFLQHDCSTLGGSSGSALLDLSNGTIIGIHFSGAFLISNWALPMWTVVSDPTIAAKLALYGFQPPTPAPVTNLSRPN